uniref:Uncharacterized protein n=1 Tax=Rhizophora mucronata TaxID=61149 RepID=A0A2P2QUX9_RHIMU
MIASNLSAPISNGCKTR